MSDFGPVERNLIALAKAQRPSVERGARLQADFVRRAGPPALAALPPALGLAVATGSGSAAAAAAAASGASASGGVLKLIAILTLLGAVGGGAAYAVHTKANTHVSTQSAPMSPLPAPAAPQPMVTSPDLRQVAPLETTTTLAPAKPPPARRAASPAPLSAPSASDGNLDQELSLMTRAHSAIAAHDPGSAIAALNEHAARFPKGQFAEEREALRIVVNCATGSAGARAKAEQFLRARPKSTLAARIHQECDGK
jgi:hypothetical protein